MTLTKKDKLISRILKRLAEECPFPPSAYVLETVHAILREELR